MNNTKPQLKGYLNIHLYLADLYKFRKATEDAFSYESWAQELGLNQRSYLRQIVIGRRTMNPEIANLVSKRLNLQGDEKEYFEVLALYSRARSASQRNIYGKKLTQLLRSEVVQSEVSNIEGFVIDPLLPRLHTLLSFHDSPKEAEEIGTFLNQSSENIRRALQSLVDMKLIDIDSSGTLKVANEHFTVPAQLGNPSLVKYHRSCLEEAIEASQLQPHRRRFESIIVALDKEEFNEFLVDLKSFIDQTLSRFNPTSLEQREIFQINFNAHSVSRGHDLTP